MNVNVGDQVTAVLSEAYGIIPPLRRDTPLSAFNFQPSDAVVLSFIAQHHNLSVPTDSDFLKIRTVGELSDILTGSPLGHADA